MVLHLGEHYPVHGWGLGTTRHGLEQEQEGGDPVPPRNDRQEKGGTGEQRGLQHATGWGHPRGALSGPHFASCDSGMMPLLWVGWPLGVLAGGQGHLQDGAMARA